MSDWALLFVPVDPNWLPSIEAAESASVYIRVLTKYWAEITSNFPKDVEFFHLYQYWQGVRCPKCFETIEDDIFYSLVTASYETSRFEDLRLVTPCCQFATSLDRLDYVTPAAFGRFVLEVMNPERDITDDQKDQLERCLGSKLHKIWRHI